MNQTSNLGDHEELELLLPWYVNGTLENSERSAVQQHLENCAECRESVALLRRMDIAVTNDSPSPIVPRPDVDGMLKQLDADKSRSHTAFGWMTPRAMAAAVAIIVIGIAALMFNRDVSQTEAQLFETATSSNAIAASGYVLAVRFHPDTTLERQQAVIAAMGGTSIGPGEQPYSLRVAVAPQAETLEELASFTREVESSPDVVSVKVLAVQLPVAK